MIREEVRDAFSRALALDGYETRTANTADSAMQAVEAMEPDAILLDLVMPGVNGLRFLYRLRETHRRTPVAVITGKSDVDDYTVRRRSPSRRLSRASSIREAVPARKSICPAGWRGPSRNDTEGHSQFMTFLADEEVKLLDFQHCFNGHRAHAGLGGMIPEPRPREEGARASVSGYRWRVHCRGLYQTPIAA